MENQNNPQPNQGNQPGPAPVNAGKSDNNQKLWAILGYILPILFFIPLVMDDLKNNPYSKFHANQQLMLLLAGIAVNIVGGIIPVLGWFVILPIGSVILIILAIIGIVNAVKNVQKPLPMIGKITILK